MGKNLIDIRMLLSRKIRIYYFYNFILPEAERPEIWALSSSVAERVTSSLSKLIFAFLSASCQARITSGPKYYIFEINK